MTRKIQAIANPVMTPAEFLDEFKLLRGEVYEATLSWHAYLMINEQMSADGELLDTMNSHPSFWQVTIRALRHNTLLVLGRVFDDDKRSHSIHNIVRGCAENPAIFSKDALRARRAAEGVPAEEEYIERAFVPDAAHFTALQTEVEACMKVWTGAYVVIRNKVVAHRDKLDKKTRADLYAKTKVKEITELLERLYVIEESLWELATNAKPLKFNANANPRVSEIVKATQGVLKSLPRPSLSPELKAALARSTAKNAAADS
ncbi:MAG: hypothetical protein HY078_12635 [Elusimicrobia bacterium]|nr:hypothetical protein [Elusimicrobiota bacterium]